MEPKKCTKVQSKVLLFQNDEYYKQVGFEEKLLKHTMYFCSKSTAVQ